MNTSMLFFAVVAAWCVGTVMADGHHDDAPVPTPDIFWPLDASHGGNPTVGESVYNMESSLPTKPVDFTSSGALFQGGGHNSFLRAAAAKLTNQFTLDFQMKWTGVLDDDAKMIPMFANENVALPDGFYFTKEGTNWLFMIGDGQKFSGIVDFPHDEEAFNNHWVRVTLRFDGVSLRLDMNGVTKQAVHAGTPFVPGNLGLGLGLKYHGHIRRLAYWKRALSDQEISGLAPIVCDAAACISENRLTCSAGESECGQCFAGMYPAYNSAQCTGVHHAPSGTKLLRFIFASTSMQQDIDGFVHSLYLALHRGADVPFDQMQVVNVKDVAGLDTEADVIIRPPTPLPVGDTTSVAGVNVDLTLVRIIDAYKNPSSTMMTSPPFFGAASLTPPQTDDYHAPSSGGGDDANTGAVVAVVILLLLLIPAAIYAYMYTKKHWRGGEFSFAGLFGRKQKYELGNTEDTSIDMHDESSSSSSSSSDSDSD